MDFANRGNRPGQMPQNTQNTGSHGQNNEQPTQSFKPMNSGKSDKGESALHKIVPVFLLFAVTVIIAALIVGLVFGGGSGNKEADLINKDRYQAIFLDSQDGQVYFGKLAIYNSSLYHLTDIFYVRVENPIQPQGENQQQQANISLAKLGNELHGPEDEMFIARDKVLYWENLKDDGQVVTAIKEFDANGRQTQQNQQTQPTGTEEVDDTPTTEDTTPADTETETETETPETTTP